MTVVPETLHVATKMLDDSCATLGISASISGDADNTDSVTFVVKDKTGKVVAKAEATLQGKQHNC